MFSDRIFRKMKISDATELQQNKLFNDTVVEVKNKIRSIQDNDNQELFYYCDKNYNQVCGINFIYKDEKHMHVEIELILQSDNAVTFTMYNRFLEILLYQIFIVEKCFKISFVLHPEMEIFEQALVYNGFIQEAILHDEYIGNGKFGDVGIFYLSLPMYKDYSCCFVPFQRGIYVLFGGKDFVDKGKIYRYGDKVTDRMTLLIGQRQGIIDDTGCFISRGYSSYYLDADDIAELPDELAKGYTELLDFFNKKSERFSLNVKMSGGTDLQRATWEIIMNIKYGTTLSYEDVAQLLTSGDEVEARKLTRAVGHACSTCPVPIIIPCHRVIGKNGKLIGYKDGLEFKDFLLMMESFSAIII